MRLSFEGLESCGITSNSFCFLCRNFMNDSFRTDVFVRYSPETIGCACIFLSARQLGVGIISFPCEGLFLQQLLPQAGRSRMG